MNCNKLATLMYDVYNRQNCVGYMGTLCTTSVIFMKYKTVAKLKVYFKMGIVVSTKYSV